MGQSIPFKSGGGANLIMPEMIVASSTGPLMIKLSGSIALSNQAAFFSSIASTHTEFGYEGVVLSAANNTLEQTIVDIPSGLGVLTNVVCPILSAAGTMTIKVIIDGVTTIFLSPNFTTSDLRYAIGNFHPSGGTAVTGNASGLGTSEDRGFTNTSTAWLMPTSVQSLQNIQTGMVFRSSLFVSIQGSSDISASAISQDCCVLHTNSIPTRL